MVALAWRVILAGAGKLAPATGLVMEMLGAARVGVNLMSSMPQSPSVPWPLSSTQIIYMSALAAQLNDVKLKLWLLVLAEAVPVKFPTKIQLLVSPVVL